MLFSEWRALVVEAYQGDDTSTSEIIRALANYARAILVRDVESDLALAKSYRDEYANQKVRFCGTPLADNLATIIPQVQAIMPIDMDTDAAAAILTNAITSAYYDYNSTAAKWDSLLLQAAIDLQRHVPFYQVRQITSYVDGGAGVTNEGFISRVPLPEFARIQQLWYGRYYAPLEPDVLYAVDDIVVSNARAYKVVTGGTLGVYDIGAGLVSTDGSNEDLGALVFTYYKPERDFPVRACNWNARNRLMTGEFTGGPLYAFPPQCDEIWLYPPLDGTNRFDLEWVGVSDDFDNTDAVTFDKTAAEAAAHYIRSMFYVSDLDDPKNGAASVALYQRALRKAVVDNQARDAGSPPSVAPYDYRRRRHFLGTCWPISLNSNNQSGDVNPNAWAAVANTGGDTTLTPTAPNMAYTLTFTGVAGLRTVILATHGRTAGDRIKLSLAFPLIEGLIIDPRNGSLAGASLLPAESFPDLTYTTDGLTTTGTMEFVFGNNAWGYVDHGIPA